MTSDDLRDWLATALWADGPASVRELYGAAQGEGLVVTLADVRLALDSEWFERFGQRWDVVRPKGERGPAW